MQKENATQKEPKVKNREIPALRNEPYANSYNTDETNTFYKNTHFD